MNSSIFIGILIPFIGTTLGAACVFLFTKELTKRTEKIFSGFAAGVMVAASIWSLLIPALEQENNWGNLSFMPAVIGFWAGIFFILLIDEITPHLHVGNNETEGLPSKLSDQTKLMLAVTIHNIPEGMAIGVVFGGLLAGGYEVTFASALALSLGIAIQNFPEGAIISLPLASKSQSKPKSFLLGMLSGIVEPIAAFITMALTNQLAPLMPYFLSFAAGAMMYVVVEELVPEMAQGKHSNIGVIAFAAGFSLMMILDVALG